jgi:hypothetical protein
MPGPDNVTFYFDPACPWTWRTSRWLDDVTHRRGIEMKFAAFELSNAASLDKVPEQYRASATATRTFLRAVVLAHEAGSDDLTATAYAFYGHKVHDDKATPSPELVRQAWSFAESERYLAALDDISLDQRVHESRKQAQELAGDDVGSPVLVFETDSGQRGFIGPVIAPTPRGADADELWDMVLRAAALPQFFELKTLRTAVP